MNFGRAIILAVYILSWNNIGYSNQHTFYGQYGQDRFLYNKFFSQKTHGVFVDIGAHNGIKFSNTYFFEKYLGWSGICVEPMPEIFEELSKNRTCSCIEGCIYDKADTVCFLRVYGTTGEYIEMLSGILTNYDPRHLERIKAEMANGRGYCKETMIKCYALNGLLEKNKLYHIDFLSIDTEGGELDILKSIDFERFSVDVICVENNYADAAFEQFLLTKGYKKIGGCPSPCDEMYVKDEMRRQEF